MRGNTYRATRIAAYVASAALVISGTVLAVSPAHAIATPDDAAASWLVGELDNGLMMTSSAPPYDKDYGLSIDAGLALASLGYTSTVEQVSGALADNIDHYTTGVDQGTPTDIYAGPVAKAAVMALAADDDPKAYGGVNLITRLEERVSSNGRISDKFTPGPFGGDYANALGQSYAANVLTDQGSTKAASVTDFLLKQQCSSGYFRLNFSATGASNQTCMNGTDPADPDATAVAVLQLSTITGNTKVTTAITNAKSWLRSQQRCDGSFGGGPTTQGSNANSTGIIAWALGDTPASRQATTWLFAHQATSADSNLSGEVGAIAYDDAALAAGRADGITDAKLGQWRRATAQAAPAIRWYDDSATPAINLTGPAGYLKAGTRQVLHTAGAAAGTVVCVNGPNASARGIAAANGLSSTIVLPAGTATRTYVATDPYGHADTQALKVLGKKTLTVTKSQYRVKRGRYVTATVSGLAPTEWARIYYKGRPIRSGFASATGTFTATFKVGRAKGKKSIVGYGMFTDIRRGATTIKVVR